MTSTPPIWMSLSVMGGVIEGAVGLIVASVNCSVALLETLPKASVVSIDRLTRPCRALIWDALKVADHWPSALTLGASLNVPMVSATEAPTSAVPWMEMPFAASAALITVSEFLVKPVMAVTTGA